MKLLNKQEYTQETTLPTRPHQERLNSIRSAVYWHKEGLSLLTPEALKVLKNALNEMMEELRRENVPTKLINLGEGYVD